MIRNIIGKHHSLVSLCPQARQLTLLPRAAIQAIKTNLDKPKGIVNGYNLFFQEKYPEVKTQFPNFGVVDIAKRAGAAWKSMSEVEKKKYIDRAVKLSEQAKIDMVSYQEKLTSRQKLARRTLHFHNQYIRGHIKRANIPKEVKGFVKGLPAAPFQTGRQMFIASKLRGQKGAQMMLSTVSAEWDRLSASEKKVFDDRATADMKVFQQNLNKYISMH